MKDKNIYSTFSKCRLSKTISQNECCKTTQMANPLLNVFKKIYKRNTGKKEWDKVHKCGMGYHKAEIMSH